LSISLLACVGAFLVRAAETRIAPRPQVFSVREFELRQGVNVEEFEAMARREFSRVLTEDKIGSRFRLLKGDRGERKGRYLLIWEFDSVAARNDYFPKEGRGCSPAFEHNWKRIKLSLEKLSGYLKEKNSYTDYVTVTD
jgi:hypothetical protein